MSLIALKLLAGNALGKLWAWLSHRSFWHLACMALAAFALLQHFQLADARHDRDSYKTQRDYYRSELTRITTAKDTQRKTTGQTIEKAKRLQVDADARAKVVESAPLKPNCQTPDAVLSADL